MDTPREIRPGEEFVLEKLKTYLSKNTEDLIIKPSQNTIRLYEKKSWNCNMWWSSCYVL